MALHHVTRRRFIRDTAAAVSAPLFIPGAVFGSGGRTRPSDRITLGFIGTGGHGMGHNLPNFLKNEDAQVLAVCDVDQERCTAAAEMVNRHTGSQDCSRYRDFREILAREDIDAVVISTPDHWHVPISLMAARAGKDVFCEKPTVTIEEGRLLSDAVKKYGIVFQAGTEDRAVPEYHRMAELVRNGRIGRLRTIRVRLPGENYFSRPPLEEQKPEPVPEGFDYDLWLGPAPEAPFCRARTHFHFRWIFDYSGGMLTDWGAHLVDTAQWGNDTERTGPVTVRAMGIFPSEGIYNTATEFLLEYEYANGVQLVITSGGTSIQFEGTDGWVGNAGWREPVMASTPEILNATIGPDEVHLFTEPAGEHRNFLDCVKSRGEPYFPAEILHRVSSVLHIGNISMLLGRKLRWDPEREVFPDDEEANSMRARTYRSPWDREVRV